VSAAVSVLGGPLPRVRAMPPAGSTVTGSSPANSSRDIVRVVELLRLAKYLAAAACRNAKDYRRSCTLGARRRAEDNILPSRGKPGRLSDRFLLAKLNSEKAHFATQFK
jgi:hypothetical protein